MRISYFYVFCLVRFFVVAVSAGIMERHGGAIGVTSSGVPGEGCVFFVELMVENQGLSLHSSLVATQETSELLFLQQRAADQCTHLQLESPSGSIAFTRTSERDRIDQLVAEEEGGEEGVCVNHEETGGLGPLTALIVDDSLLNVKMARRVLSIEFDEILEVNYCFSRLRSHDGLQDVMFMLHIV